MMNDEKKSKYFFITGHFFITVLRVLLVQKKINHEIPFEIDVQPK